MIYDLNLRKVSEQQITDILGIEEWEVDRRCKKRDGTDTKNNMTSVTLYGSQK